MEPFEISKFQSSPPLPDSQFHNDEDAERIDAKLILNVSPTLYVRLRDSHFRSLMSPGQRRGPVYARRDGTFNIVFSSENFLEQKNTNLHIEWAIDVAYQVKAFLEERSFGLLNSALINLIWWPLKCDGFDLCLSPNNMERMARLGIYMEMWVSYYGDCVRNDDEPLFEDEDLPSPPDGATA